MSVIEPTENRICPDCKTKLPSSGFNKHRCKKCGNKEYDNALIKMFGIGG